MTAVKLNVGADLLIIPDGMSEGVLRLGIQVTPSRQFQGNISLDEWPNAIATLARKVRIHFGDLNNRTVTEFGHEETTSKLVDFMKAPHVGDAHKTHAQAASELWQRIFEQIGMDKLFDALRHSTAKAFVGKRAPKVSSTRMSDLQLFFDSYFEACKGLEPLLSRTSTLNRLAQIPAQATRWMTEEQVIPTLRQDIDGFAQRAKTLSQLKRGFAALFDESRVSVLMREDETAIANMFREYATLLGQATQPDPPQPDIDETEWGTDPEEAAKRKLGGLLSIPTLAHYFGLGVQVEVPLSALQGRTHGVIAAEFVDEPQAKPAWTVFELHLQSSYFGPAPDPDRPAKPEHALYRQGFLNLSATFGDGGDSHKRFMLGTKDVVNMAQDLIAIRNRAHDDEEPFPELNNRRRGIVLYDLAAREDRNEENLRTLDSASRADEAPIKFLNDMFKGIRPDFGIAPRGVDVLALDVGRWRSVTARSVRCIDPLLDPTFYDDPFIRDIAERDHGFAMMIPSVDKTGKVEKVEDERFVWAGENLAVSAEMRDGVPVSTEFDLGLNLVYSLLDPKSSAEFNMPPLREQIRYVCGCRLVYANGAGLRFKDAKERYAKDATILLGDTLGKPLRYPLEVIPAPDVHLKWDDELISCAEPQLDAPGESSGIMVIHDGRSKAMRLVTPPRASFDGGELQGQFDDVIKDVPPGALQGEKGLWLFGPKGSFPEARFGDRHGAIRWLDDQKSLNHIPIPIGSSFKPRITIGDKEYQKMSSRQSRGTVAILGRRHGEAKDGAPFYANKNGRRLNATLKRTSVGKPLAIAPVEAVRSFWEPKQEPNAALPILVQLEHTNNEQPLIDDEDVITIRDIETQFRSIPLLSVRLPMGETCELGLRAISPDAQSKEARLTLVHAVKVPLKLPSFTPAVTPPRRCTAAGLGLNAISVSVCNDDSKRAGLQSWAEKVHDFEASGIDMRCWPSEEGGSTTFFAGRVAFDRKSTGVVRCEAEWVEFSEATVTRTTTGRWVQNPTSETSQLFKLDVERSGDEGVLDLLRKPGNQELRDPAITRQPGQLRRLAYAFRDGRARELKVKMVATSAFTEFYARETTIPKGRDEIGKYECQSSTFAQAPSVWTECTYRPPPPKIDRILPFFSFEKIDGKVESLQRRAHLRIHLDEGWYASGADERLGIVLLDQDDPKTVCDYENGRLGPYHRFIARAGADPVIDSSAVPIRLDARHFPNAPPEVKDVLLFLGDAKDGSAPLAPLPVKVLPFKPEFSPEDGLYCDVEVSVGSAYMPFLQLGLVRYQQHAVERLELSHPIEYQVQLIPDRRLWIEERPGNGKRAVIVEGPGFEVPSDDQPAHKRPVLDLRILSWNENAKEWQGAPAPIAKDLVPNIVDGATKLFRWETTIDLPLNGFGLQHFILVVQEFERRPADHFTGQFHEGRAVFKDVESRRLTFSALPRLRYPQR